MKDTLSKNSRPAPPIADVSIDDIGDAFPPLNTGAGSGQESNAFVDQIDENMATVIGPDGSVRLMPVTDLPRDAAEGSNVDPHDIYQGDEAENPRLKELVNMLYAVPQ